MPILTRASLTIRFTYGGDWHGPGYLFAAAPDLWSIHQYGKGTGYTLTHRPTGASVFAAPTLAGARGALVDLHARLSNVPRDVLYSTDPATVAQAIEAAPGAMQVVWAARTRRR